nr:putative ribonuclease H-like domain-containing protein [Tanacetum cinerariifolium]
SANKKQEFVKMDDKKVEKKDDEKKRDMSKVKCYSCKKEGHFAKDCKKVKVKDYEYYKTKMLLAKKDKDEQVLLAEDQAWMESSSDWDQKINANMVFIAQIKKVLSDSETSSSSADDKIFEVSYYLSESESESEYETSEYYDNTTTYGLFMNDNDDQKFFHDCKIFPGNLIESQINHNESAVDHNDSEGVDKLIRKFNKKIVKCLKSIKKANQQNKDFENQNKDLQDKYDVLKNQATTSEMKNKEYAKLEAERYEYMIRYSAYFDNDKQHRKQITDPKVLYDKMNVQLVELDKHVRDLKNMVLEKDFKIYELEECVRNKYLEIEKCLERLNVCENKLHKMGETNQTVHMIMPFKDTLYNDKKEIGFKNPSYFEKAKDLRPSLYDEKVIGLVYTLMFLTHSDEALKIEKFKRARENRQKSSLKPYVSTVILEKIIIDLEDKVVSLLEKEKQTLKTIESLKSNDVETGVQSSEKVVYETENQSENDCQVFEKECHKVVNSKVIAPGMFELNVSQSVSPISVTKKSCASNGVENLDTLSSVRRPKSNGVMWIRKGSSNTVKANLSFVSHSKLNKDVKRYSRKDLLSCNNPHLGETSSAYVCNDTMNVSCNSRLCDSFDENNLFIFDDESVRISSVSTMHFRKKPCHSLNIVQICLWIIDSRCSKHMMGNRALLTKFVEKFLGTVRFGNNDFMVFFLHSKDEASDVIISFIKKTQVNLQLQVQRVRTDNGTEFKNKTLAKFFNKVGITQQFSAARTPQQNGVMERRNRTLVEPARTMLTFANLPLFLWDEAIATACFTQNRSIIHKRFDKTPYELINKRKPNIIFFRVFGCRCYLLNDYEDIGSSRQKGILECLLDIQKSLLLSKICYSYHFIIQTQRKKGRFEGGEELERGYKIKQKRLHTLEEKNEKQHPSPCEVKGIYTKKE